MPNFSLPFVHTSTWNSGLGAVLTQQISWASGPVVPEKEKECLAIQQAIHSLRYHPLFGSCPAAVAPSHDGCKPSQEKCEHLSLRIRQKKDPAFSTEPGEHGPIPHHTD